MTNMTQESPTKPPRRRRKKVDFLMRKSSVNETSSSHLQHVLAIDVGNTRLKWALHDGAGWAAQGACSTSDIIAPSTLVAEWAELAPHFVSHFVSHFAPRSSPSLPSHLPNVRAMISTVADKSITPVVMSALHAIGCESIELVVPKALQCGVRNGYSDPTQLGSDRWMALIAAFGSMKRETTLSGAHVYPQLVVMAGTALTIDALAADGEFLGGVIVPGATLMRAALKQGTARLPANRGDHELFPTNTDNAIATGAIEACLGAMQRMHGALIRRSGVDRLSEVRCIASGGGLAVLAQHWATLSFAVAVHDNLVLDGLIRLAYEI